jgi:hypothetical protein
MVRVFRRLAVGQEVEQPGVSETGNWLLAALLTYRLSQIQLVCGANWLPQQPTGQSVEHPEAEAGGGRL